MSAYAELDENNVVVRAIVADSIDWVMENLGGNWVETVTDGNTKSLASVGFTYDEERDAFIPPKPFESWVLDEDTCLWVAPVPYPEDGGVYTWDEDAGDWIEVPSE